MNSEQKLDVYDWQVSYKTSDVKADGSSVDILHDFYIPALKHSCRYDRVAGYFRSTSLAAASQGFSAFTAQSGKMRLVVGCDLNPADVAVVLKGGRIDADEAGRVLQDELGESDGWPEDVTRGVELLAWMLSKGHLEIKVAFRVHRITGEPISVDSTEDGYVHEKWALFHDDEDNCLMIEGSLNESRMALSHNAENVSVCCGWWSGKHMESIERGRMNFERIWRDESPALRVMSLPSAVEQRLLRLAKDIKIPQEIDGSSAAEAEIPQPDPLEILKFRVIADAPRMPGGRYVGMYTAPVEPWPHQEIVARRLIESWPYNWLLCDEVGLGKTIEAGLALRSLQLSGLAKRILIAAPASLCRQWQREMAGKFLMPFWLCSSVRNDAIFPEESTVWSKTVFDENLIIVSTALMARKERRRELKSADHFEIALVDEAHYARRSNVQREDNRRKSGRYNGLLETIREDLKPKTKSLLLATATPMQLDPIEVYDLLELTDRVGPFQLSPTLSEAYYKTLGKVLRTGADPKPEEWDLLRRTILSIERTDPILWDFLKNTVIDRRIRISVERWLDQGAPPRGADLRHFPRFIFSAAPLSRVMLRHTRSLLEVYKNKGELKARLARRTIKPIPRIQFNEQEQKAYDQLETYCNELKRQIERHTLDQNKRTAMGFYLSFLRLRFASSLFAIKQTVGRRIERVIATLEHQIREEGKEEDVDWESLLSETDEDDDSRAVRTLLKERTSKDLQWELDHLREMKSNLEDLSGIGSKMSRLFEELNKRRETGTGRIRQTVIFSRFFDTVSDIRDRLRDSDPGMLIGTYSGQQAGGQYVDPRSKRLININREVVKRRFTQGEVDVLICTDAAAEGLNLQSADLLVNFDLPWNPMKVEQRIGRIDRIGQKHEEIFVLNLCYPGSAEEIVYGRLLQRLSSASSVVGQQQVSMLPVTTTEFQELAENKLSEEALKDRAEFRIAAQKEREATIQIPADDLYTIYSQLASKAKSEKHPVTLSQIEKALKESSLLRNSGALSYSENNQTYLKTGNVDRIPPGVSITASRALFDSGLPGGGPVHFASYGDPVFDAILGKYQEFDLPACIRRVEIPVTDTHAEIVAWVVATTEEDGPTLKLITEFSQLDSLHLDEAYSITDEELDQIKQKLKAQAQSEASRASITSRVQKQNVDAAEAQRYFELMIAAYLLKEKRKYYSEDQFWPLLRQVDEFVLQRPLLDVSLEPLALLQKIADRLIFSVQAPQLGDSGHAEIPDFLTNAALDQAARLADRLHRRQRDCTVESVLNRIRSELI